MPAIGSNSPPAKLSRLSIVGQICGVPVADGRNWGVPLAEADWLILTAGGRPLCVSRPCALARWQSQGTQQKMQRRAAPVLRDARQLRRHVCTTDFGVTNRRSEA